jgi:anti-sigma B factor antagonist
VPIAYDEYTKVAVLTPDGDLAGGAASGELRRAVDASLGAGRVADVVIDLSRARVIDSAALETLLWAKRRTESHGGRLALAGPGADVRTVFELTRLDRRFECHADLPAALKAVA